MCHINYKVNVFEITSQQIKEYRCRTLARIPIVQYCPNVNYPNDYLSNVLLPECILRFHGVERNGRGAK